MSDDGKEKPVNDADDNQALAALDVLLDGLPLESPPDALVDRTLRAVEREQDDFAVAEESPATAPRSRWRGHPSWRLVAAALLVAFFVVGVAAVQFGGRLKALFETADAELDTVDSDL